MWLVAAWHSRSPYLLFARELAFWTWISAGAAALLWILFSKRQGRRSFGATRVLAIAAVLGAIFAGYGRWQHAANRAIVESCPADRMPELGDHLVVGWLGFEETRKLATKGAIAGVFLTRRDFPSGASISDIRKTVDALQLARREAGLPRLWIATDQEGGTVEKLSPPIPPIPALAKLIGKADMIETVRLVTEHSETQAKALAEAGINMNFAPVVDLMPSSGPDVLDFHSRIATRALSADPEKVALAGAAYVMAMQRHGITAILKHFPGLGSVSADTHHFAATLDPSIAELEKLDWLPFREIANTTDAGVMLGHVRVTALDPDFPASGSSKVARLLREQMRPRGPLVTDDFSMAPIFHGPGGMDRAARRSMDAGVDIILISYDAEAVYDLLAAQMDQRDLHSSH